MQESVSVLQVTQGSVSGTTSHVCCVWTCNEIEDSCDKIIITIVPSYTEKKYHSFVAVGIVTRASHSSMVSSVFLVYVEYGVVSRPSKFSEYTLLKWWNLSNTDTIGMKNIYVQN